MEKGISTIFCSNHRILGHNDFQRVLYVMNLLQYRYEKKVLITFEVCAPYNKACLMCQSAKFAVEYECH